MPFTLSHAAIAPLWGRSRRSTPATILALACGSVAPDLVRLGFPARMQTPSHTVLAAFTTDTIVGLVALALTTVFLGPALEFVAPRSLVGLVRPLQPAVPWRGPGPVVLATSAGALLHILVDLPSHAPSDWMELGPLNAEWLRLAPFSLGGDPYPWHYINRLVLSVVGLAGLGVTALRIDRSVPAPTAPTPAALASRFGVIVCGIYGAIATRFYTNRDFDRRIIDVAIDVVVGATVGLTLSLFLVGCSIRLGRRALTRGT